MSSSGDHSTCRPQSSHRSLSCAGLNVRSPGTREAITLGARCLRPFRFGLYSLAGHDDGDVDVMVEEEAHPSGSCQHLAGRSHVGLCQVWVGLQNLADVETMGEVFVHC